MPVSAQARVERPRGLGDLARLVAHLRRRRRARPDRARAPTRPSTPASTSSTRPTSTAAAPRRAPRARSSRRGRATRTCWRRRSGSRCRTRDRGLSRGADAKQIDASLARLQTDYVDLYQCHRFDPDVAARGDDARRSPRSSRAGQGALPRLQRVDARADPGGARRSPGVAMFVSLAAAVLDALAGAGGRGLPALRGERDRADRLVAARAGRADRQVPPGRGAAGRLARGERRDGLVRWAAARSDERARGACSACARSPSGRHHDGRSSRSRGCCAGPSVASAIVGASRPEQVRDNAAASGIELDARRWRRSTSALG